MLKVARLMIESRLRLSCTDLYYARGAQRLLAVRVGGATSQLNLSSLTPLSVAGCAGCGRLQPGLPIGLLLQITVSS